MKIPIDYILERSFQLLDLVATVEYSSDVIDEFNSYIEACGWTNEEFDAALLLIINNNWESLVN